MSASQRAGGEDGTHTMLLLHVNLQRDLTIDDAVFSHRFLASEHDTTEAWRRRDRRIVIRWETKQ